MSMPDPNPPMPSVAATWPGAKPAVAAAIVLVTVARLAAMGAAGFQRPSTVVVFWYGAAQSALWGLKSLLAIME